jgi:GR25 family glycosyltransferase involved in LPS biosynthesis
MNEMEHAFLKKCPKFFYINMDRSPERKEEMEKQFKSYKLSFERVQGVDGNQLKSWDERLSRYEQGCTLSHLKALETFYQSKEEIGIICEDDITFEFLPIWKFPIRKVIEKAPDDWEIIMISYTVWPQNYKFLDKLYNSFIPIVHNSTCAYLINRKGAQNILNKHSYSNPKLEEYTKIRPVADVVLYDNAKTYVYRYCLFTYSDQNISTIHGNHNEFHIQSKNLAKIIFNN